MIKRVRELVKKIDSEENYRFHVSLVVKYSLYLADIKKADPEIVELAALLHDIGKIRFGSRDHDLTGPPEAAKILKQLSFKEQVIGSVKECIRTHRGIKETPAKTLEAKIIRDADAIAHFDVIPVYIKIALKKFDGDIRKSIEWLDAKIERDWKMKIHFPESKRIAKDKYNSAKLLLESTKACF